MSLSVPIGAGLLVGGLAAFAVYTSAGPLEVEAGAAPSTAASTVTPRPMVTVLAEGCQAPAVRVGGECVATAVGPAVHAPGTAVRKQASDDHGGDREQDHGHDRDRDRDRDHDREHGRDRDDDHGHDLDGGREWDDD